MTTAFWCVLVAALLPICAVGLAKASAGFDNQAPREWLGRLGGWRARAHAAHLNSFEAFAPFAAAVIIAHRLATAMRCDRIAVVEAGQVVEHGTHAELVALGGRYAEMYATWLAHLDPHGAHA